MFKQKRVLAKSALVLKVALVLALPLAIAPWLFWVAQTEAFKLATTSQPEHFTELYFTDPLNLPTATAAGQTASVRFVVHNHEARDVTYTYELRIVAEDGKVQSAVERQVLVPKGEAESITETITAPSTGDRSEVIVELKDKGQTIHFWLEGSTS